MIGDFDCEISDQFPRSAAVFHGTSELDGIGKEGSAQFGQQLGSRCNFNNPLMAALDTAVTLVEVNDTTCLYKEGTWNMGVYGNKAAKLEILRYLGHHQ